MRVISNSGKSRLVLDWCSATAGTMASTFGRISARSAGGSSLAYPSYESAPSSTWTAALDRRLWTHAGFLGLPPYEPKMIVLPSMGQVHQRRQPRLSGLGACGRQQQ